jgi:hypothetical protein
LIGIDIALLEKKIIEAIKIFDEMNSLDPNRIQFQGNDFPKEILYANWLTLWVEKLSPIISDSLRLASRCQHLKRWEISRDKYPNGLKGYMQWKKELLIFHADESEKVLRSFQIDESLIKQVRQINLKQDMQNNYEVQIIEDALCLVTLEFQLEEFSLKHTDDKIIEIIKKSWQKMSDSAKEEAKKISYNPRVLKLVIEAIK